MVFNHVEVESVKKINTENWDQEVIIKAYKKKKLYRYYYASIIGGGGWRVLNRKPNERETAHQIEQEGLALQNHPVIKSLFANHDFHETKLS